MPTEVIGGDRDHVQDADVQVGQQGPIAERDHREDHGQRGKSDHRGRQVDDVVGAGRYDVLFQQDLDRIGNRLKQAEGADAVGAEPRLHAPHGPAFDIDKGDHADQDKDQQDDTEDYQVPPEVARPIRGKAGRDLRETAVNHRLPVDLTHGDIDAAEDDYQVLYLPADGHFFERRQVDQ